MKIDPNVSNFVREIHSICKRYLDREEERLQEIYEELKTCEEHEKEELNINQYECLTGYDENSMFVIEHIMRHLPFLLEDCPYLKKITPMTEKVWS